MPIKAPTPALCWQPSGSGPSLAPETPLVKKKTKMRSRSSCRLSHVIALWLLLCCACLLLLLTPPAGAFVSVRKDRTTAVRKIRQRVAITPADDSPIVPSSRSYFLSREEIKPIFQLGSGDKEKLVNAFGLWTLVVSLVTCPIWAAAMSLLNLVYKVNGDAWDPHRALYDTTGKVWSKCWLTLSNSMPTFSGHLDQLQEGTGPCLYVANHASWLDIPILCTVLDPVFKFIAKGELRGVPCIGQQLVGGQHILIDREDRKSQIRTFKDGIKWLKRGVPLMAFPEGKRSKDGRLMEFKGGLFSMAAKTKCPIVPITLSHAHAVMPCNALFPVQSGRGKLHVHVHEPIDAVGRSEDELVELVRQAFASTLPEEQQPLESKARLVVDAEPRHHASSTPLNGEHHVSLTAMINRIGEDELAPPAVVGIKISNSGATEDPTSEEVASQLAESAP